MCNISTILVNDEPGTMRSGMAFTIEPILTHGSHEIEVLKDGWTAVTADGARSAQFEHTILITPSGFEVLTLPDGDEFPPPPP